MKKYDNFIGTVTSKSSKGIYITGEEGVTFSYGWTHLPIGSRVLCTVWREKNGNLHPRVSVDSIMSYARRTAS